MYKNKYKNFATEKFSDLYVEMTPEEEEIFNKYGSDAFIIKDDECIINPNFKQEQVQKRESEFNKEFFLTSLGYIRRQVNMATGEKKDFLSDLLPAISMGVTLGQDVPIITYNKPDFTKELNLEYMESLQEVKNVTPQFIQECALQVSKDFLPTSLTANPSD